MASSTSVSDQRTYVYCFFRNIPLSIDIPELAKDWPVLIFEASFGQQDQQFIQGYIRARNNRTTNKWRTICGFTSSVSAFVPQAWIDGDKKKYPGIVDEWKTQNKRIELVYQSIEPRRTSGSGRKSISAYKTDIKCKTCKQIFQLKTNVDFVCRGCVRKKNKSARKASSNTIQFRCGCPQALCCRCYHDVNGGVSAVLENADQSSPAAVDNGDGDDDDDDVVDMKGGDSDFDYENGECVWAKEGDYPWWPGQIQLPSKKKRGRRKPKHETITVVWYGDLQVPAHTVQKRCVIPWDPDEIESVLKEVHEVDVEHFLESVDECNKAYMQRCEEPLESAVEHDKIYRRRERDRRAAAAQNKERDIDRDAEIEQTRAASANSNSNSESIACNDETDEKACTDNEHEKGECNGAKPSAQKQETAPTKDGAPDGTCTSNGRKRKLEEDECNGCGAHKKMKRASVDEWNVADILAFFIQIGMERYVERIQPSFEYQEVNGFGLKQMDKDDLLRFGINNFQDQIHILNEIKKL